MVEIDVANNPFEWATKLEEAGWRYPQETKRKGLFELTNLWTTSIVKYAALVKSRFKIEACIGDVSSVLEQIRYGIVGHRSAGEAGQVASRDVTVDVSENVTAHSQSDVSSAANPPSTTYKYPLLYDRIHLSNIPDHIGGTLITFLNARPVLHDGDESYVTSTCLRNPPRWKSVAHFNNEYTALSSPADLEVFHVRMEPRASHSFDPLPLRAYLRWHQCLRSKTLAGKMARADLETWLYRLFLKLSIPEERRIKDDVLIYSPLNLTVFLRLCDQMHKIGYPAHWISGVLSAILSGRITTKVGPPRSEPLKIKEVKANMPSLGQSTRPFVAELSTLLGIWSPILSFGVQTPNIPAPYAVGKYYFTLDSIPDDPVAEPPAFILVFLDKKLTPQWPPDIRPYLLTGELDNAPTTAKEVREGFHVLTKWTWDRTKMGATFWLRQDVMDYVRKDERHFAVWRSDDWRAQTKLLQISIVQDQEPFRN